MLHPFKYVLIHSHAEDHPLLSHKVSLSAAAADPAAAAAAAVAAVAAVVAAFFASPAIAPTTPFGHTKLRPSPAHSRAKPIIFQYKIRRRFYEQNSSLLAQAKSRTDHTQQRTREDLQNSAFSMQNSSFLHRKFLVVYSPGC